VIISLLSSIVGGVSGYFKDKHEIKKAKLEGELAIIQAETNSKIAISEAKIFMAKQGQVNDYNLDMMAMKAMEKSYKDEFLLLLFSVPMIMAFLPEYSEKALRGFVVVAEMPEWYQYTFIGMIVVIYGMRGMLSQLLTGRKAFSVSKHTTTYIPKKLIYSKRKAKGLVIHCSDSPQGRGDDVSTIDRWHRERGFDEIGYHFVILEDGTIQEGRSLSKKGAHAIGYNDYVGICLIGIDTFTTKQFDSLEELIRSFDVVTDNVIGHYKVSSKTCPNFDVDAFKHKRGI